MPLGRGIAEYSAIYLYGEDVYAYIRKKSFVSGPLFLRPVS